MKVAILTSSRADYSIYLPLLKKLNEDGYFSLEVIAFGTHLSKAHGYTVENIEKDGFQVAHKIETVPLGNSAQDISNSIGTTISSFSKLWGGANYDLVFALGDRYEMFAAVTAGVPFNIKFVHIHGGETTLGAIDNVFRHSITHFSKIHFATTDVYAKRIQEIIGSDKDVYNVGALSIDNLTNLELLNNEEFKRKFNIDLSKPSILSTFHPETVSIEKNEAYVNEFIAALNELKSYQIIITMPNADTMGNLVRKHLQEFISKNENVIGVENFGTIGYLSCMKHCSFMLGNTSSGFGEAAYFPKFVINIGNRQAGRILTPNIVNCEITKQDIMKAVSAIESKIPPTNCNIYGEGNTADKIVQIIKSKHG